MYDIVIKNGKIIDGTGSPSYFADVAIKDGKIVKIGKGIEGGIDTIDATGLCVTPGFIDSHSHADSSILYLPEHRDKVEQGITTNIGGQCGESVAPLSRGADPKDYTSVFEGLGNSFDVRKDLAGFLKKTRDFPQGSNTAVLMGHGSLRKAVMGMENRAPTDAELEEMKRQLRDAMEEGCLGMSFGFFYSPGCYADTQEGIELAKVVAEYHGVIASHIRSEGDHLIKAVKEFISIAEAAGVRAVISHHKSYARDENWGKVTHTLRMIDEANARGVEVYCDVYPYTASSTVLSEMFFPKPEFSKPREERIKLLDDPSYREMLKKHIVDLYGKTEFSWVKTTTGNPYPDCQGMTISQMAQKFGKDEFTMLFDYMRDSGLRSSACFFTICEEDMMTVLSHPRAMVCTDSGNAGENRFHHPRLRGTFPRVLGRYVREKKVTSLPEMIRKMTSMPARVYGLKTKGLIWENMDADICIFDENKIIDKADYDNCRARAEGLNYVLINGKIVVKDAVSNGGRYGKVVLYNGR